MAEGQYGGPRTLVLGAAGWIGGHVARFNGEIAEEAQGSATRSGTVPWQWADTAAVHRELGWAPRYLLPDSLSQAWSAPTGTGPAHLHLAHT